MYSWVSKKCTIVYVKSEWRGGGGGGGAIIGYFLANLNLSRIFLNCQYRAVTSCFTKVMEKMAGNTPPSPLFS